ncbi:MAG: ABC transporter substrate-binding protein, partial [Planctomycetota bacterium]|nr:ABC transporter substrate-binding protein [Planctomycetota bacterium]
MRRVLALLLVCTACSESGSGNNEIIGKLGTARYGAFDEAAAKKGGQVVMPLLADIDTFNPYLSMSASTNNLNHVIYPRAIRENADFHKGPSTFQPGLVDEWKVDDKQIRMHIRDDAVWSDGVPITAADARFSWQTATNKHVAWTNRSSVDFITDVEVKDDKTFVVHFSQTYPYMLYDARFWRIIPKHVYGKVPFEEWKSYKRWDEASKVSSGPYMVHAQKRGEEIVLAPNEKYWDKSRPRLGRIIFRIIKSRQTIFESLLTGELDGQDFLQPRQRIRALKDERYRVYTFDGLIYDYIGWNNEHPIFNDPEVRRALTLAIDRDNIVEGLLGGQAKVMASPMLSTLWANDPSIKPLPYDTDEALAILKRRGWRRGEDGILHKDGKPFEFSLTTNAGNERREAIVQLVQSDLKEIGIKVHARIIDFNTMIENIRHGKEDAWVIGWWLGTKIDPTSLFHSKSIGGINGVRFRDELNDRLLDEGRLETDLKKAKDIWRRWQHN